MLNNPTDEFYFIFFSFFYFLNLTGHQSSIREGNKITIKTSVLLWCVPPSTHRGGLSHNFIQTNNRASCFEIYLIIGTHKPTHTHPLHKHLLFPHWLMSAESFTRRQCARVAIHFYLISLFFLFRCCGFSLLYSIILFHPPFSPLH